MCHFITVRMCTSRLITLPCPQGMTMYAQYGSISSVFLTEFLANEVTSVVRKGNLRLGLTSQLAEPILSAESARNLGRATVTITRFSTNIADTVRQSSIFSSYTRDHQALARQWAQSHTHRLSTLP